MAAKLKWFTVITITLPLQNLYIESALAIIHCEKKILFT